MNFMCSLYKVQDMNTHGEVIAAAIVVVVVVVVIVSISSANAVYENECLVKEQIVLKQMGTALCCHLLKGCPSPFFHDSY
jgi:hypothetical protein